MNHLKGHIKQARLAAGLTQEELAEIVDVSVNTISNYECGRAQPRQQHLEAIAQATERPVAWFFEETDGETTDSRVRARVPGSRRDRAEQRRLAQAAGQAGRGCETLVLPDMPAASLGAGPGLPLHADGSLCMPACWLLGQSQAVLAQVVEALLETTMRPGDLVVVSLGAAVAEGGLLAHCTPTAPGELVGCTVHRAGPGGVPASSKGPASGQGGAPSPMRTGRVLYHLRSV